MKPLNSKTVGRTLIIITALLWGLAGVCVKSITMYTLLPKLQEKKQ